MTTRDRLRHDVTYGEVLPRTRDDMPIDTDVDPVHTLTMGDARKLLALVEACIEEQRVMEIAGNVKPGIDADAAWEAYDDAARATQAALATLTHPEAPDA